MALIDLSTQQVSPAIKFYDQVAGVNASGDTETSITVRQPEAIQAEGIVAGTDHVVEVRVHSNALWVPLVTITSAGGAVQKIDFTIKYNFVRVRRTVGAVDSIWHSQSARNEFL